jgi:hypothetical protein
MRSRQRATGASKLIWFPFLLNLSNKRLSGAGSDL